MNLVRAAVEHGLAGLIRVGKRVELECMDTPGHTMCHICLRAHGDRPQLRRWGPRARPACNRPDREADLALGLDLCDVAVFDPSARRAALKLRVIRFELGRDYLIVVATKARECH